MRRTRLPALLTLALAACAPHEAYVRADAETYLILAPYTRAGIKADATLDEDQKMDRIKLVESWETRIRLNEGFK
jgi:hypothetical protein